MDLGLQRTHGPAHRINIPGTDLADMEAFHTEARGLFRGLACRDESVLGHMVMDTHDQKQPCNPSPHTHTHTNTHPVNSPIQVAEKQNTKGTALTHPKGIYKTI